MRSKIKLISSALYFIIFLLIFCKIFYTVQDGVEEILIRLKINESSSVVDRIVFTLLDTVSIM